MVAAAAAAPSQPEQPFQEAAEADAMAGPRSRGATASHAALQVGDAQDDEAAGPSTSGRGMQGAWARLRRFKPMGLEPSPELAAIAVAYFVQGMKTQVADLAEKYFMKDNLQMNPAQMDMWLVVAHIPWIIKPLYGFVTDTYPIGGLRRRPYLVLCGLCGSAAFAALGVFPPSAGLALALMTSAELAIAFSDVVIDGVVVERSRGEALATAGALQSVCWGSQALGSLSSAYGSGWLIEHLGPRPVLSGLGAFPLLICLTAFLINEADDSALKAKFSAATKSSASAEAELVARAVDPSKPESPGFERLNVPENGVEGWSSHGREEETIPLFPDAPPPDDASLQGWAKLTHQLHMLWRAVRAPAILLPATFLFLWNATPYAKAAMFAFYTNQLHFSPEFLGRMQLMDGTAQLIGVLLFNSFLRRVELRRIFLWLTLIGVGAGLTQLLLVTGANRALGISDGWFALVDSALLTGLARIALMPTLVMAARICPEGVEATLYAALMSINNAGAGVGESMGAVLTQLLGVTSSSFRNLPWLSLLCTVSGLAVLPLLSLVPQSL